MMLLPNVDVCFSLSLSVSPWVPWHNDNCNNNDDNENKQLMHDGPPFVLVLLLLSLHFLPPWSKPISFLFAWLVLNVDGWACVSLFSLSRSLSLFIFHPLECFLGQPWVALLNRVDTISSQLCFFLPSFLRPLSFTCLLNRKWVVLVYIVDKRSNGNVNPADIQ